MLKSCFYCGRIHDDKCLCNDKKNSLFSSSSKKLTKAAKFRSSYAWTKSRDSALKRDKYCCVLCNYLNDNNFRKFNSDCLEVHHIIPIIENYELRNNLNNLITVCRRHHEECEKGVFSKEFQKKLIFDDKYDFEVIV